MTAGARHRRATQPHRSALRRPNLQPLAPLALAALLVACGGGKKKTNAPAATPTIVVPSIQTARTTPALAAGSPTTPAQTPTAFPQATIRPGTPLAGSPTPSATPAASATPGVRTEDGLQIQDVAFTGKVAASGGLRIRSAPSVSADNVVGSVAEGATVNVEGKVLNGAEAESGKGTVWCIVGVKQYVYCPEGYITNIGAPAPPAPASTPGR